MKKELQNVTLVAITTKDFGTTVAAIKKSLEQIKPHSVLFFTNIKFDDPDYECVLIPKLDWQKYNEFVFKDLWGYITTSHVLLIQHDGYVLDGSAWTDEFLEYDYIGAPWLYKDGKNVGNGGFSLRSKRLQHILATDENINEVFQIYAPEDECICRLYRGYLEKHYNIKFAPEELAHQFSFEMHAPKMPTFGFHNHFHQPYKESVILKRTCAMGDIIMLEPVMEHFHKKEYRVILDCPADYFHLFQYHHYPVLHISQVSDTEGISVINLDMSYESKPKQLALKSYYEFCGIQDGELRNSKLNFPVDDTTRLFNKYVVLHIDDTDMPYRNVRGIDWDMLVGYLKTQGYEVFQVGGKPVAGIKMQTPTKNMLMYMLSGADMFIGVDSGPSQVAVALGVKSVIFFGSVNPEYRYADMTNIRAIQKPCDSHGCYHSVIGVRGTDCIYDVKNPPCCTYTNGEDDVFMILDKIDSLK